jgi:DNA-binding transcriptional MerR regulator
MRIGELAATTGVSTDTIRYYEKFGLLPPARRTESGYREYSHNAGNRIRVIRNAVQLGFPLAEIAKVLRVRDSGGAPCRQVRDYAQTLIKQIEERIEELRVEKASMVRMVAEWDLRLAQANGARARLLEDVPVPDRARQPRRARLPRRR